MKNKIQKHIENLQALINDPKFADAPKSVQDLLLAQLEQAKIALVNC